MSRDVTFSFPSLTSPLFLLLLHSQPWEFPAHGRLRQHGQDLDTPWLVSTEDTGWARGEGDGAGHLPGWAAHCHLLLRQNLQALDGRVAQRGRLRTEMGTLMTFGCFFYIKEKNRNPTCYSSCSHNCSGVWVCLKHQCWPRLGWRQVFLGFSHILDCFYTAGTTF